MRHLLWFCCSLCCSCTGALCPTERAQPQTREVHQIRLVHSTLSFCPSHLLLRQSDVSSVRFSGSASFTLSCVLAILGKDPLHGSHCLPDTAARTWRKTRDCGCAEKCFNASGVLLIHSEDCCAIYITEKREAMAPSIYRSSLTKRLKIVTIALVATSTTGCCCPQPHLQRLPFLKWLQPSRLFQVFRGLP